MSGSNAISGITVVGAILSLLGSFSVEAEILRIIFGSAAVFFATVNVVGGYLVTDRMLSMFDNKEDAKK
jgi:NAD(P) transhydrogenase subunit alpha